MKTWESWGRFIPSRPARVVELSWIDSPPLTSLPGPLLPYGMGRSYGDVCLNNGGTLLDTTGLQRFRRFDSEEGVLECEAGTTLEQILALVVPHGWFVPVTPGTKFVTVGGCIANDVHGKNHHRAGTFGRWIRSFELRRADGSVLRCSPSENSELFAATIGGLGLTGLITTAEIALRRIESPGMVVEQIPFQSLATFDELSRSSDATHEYTVAWVDSFSGRHSRGILFRGNHAPHAEGESGRRRPRRLPVRAVSPLLRPATVRLFNEFYYRANSRPDPFVQHYDPFFYPLDAVANWNTVYGSKGFLQYQCVIPEAAGLEPVAEILDRAARSQRASFLTTLKRFGALRSPGLLSFPRPGMTLCLDFAAGSPGLPPLLESFDDIVDAAGGSIYPAKDSRLTPARFRRFFPQSGEFEKFVSPGFSSSFWRRVTA